MTKFKYAKGHGMQHLYNKECVRPEDADKIALGVLVCLDGGKRGQMTNQMSNSLSRHLLAAVVLWTRQGNEVLYKRAVEAVNAMDKAVRRPGDSVALTTTEYQLIRKSVGYYLRAMPRIEVGQLHKAHMLAEKAFQAA